MKHAFTELAELLPACLSAATSDAQALAEDFLATVGTRLAHSQGVVAQAKRVEPILAPPWQSAISSAAWVHDIGYANDVTATGFHQLDGARWLAARGWPMVICRLVAWHTGAENEAALRGYAAELAAEFVAPPAIAAGALTWADLTISPLGSPWTVERRLADILRRHPPDSIVHLATLAARPQLLDAVRTVEARLAAEGLAA